MSNMNFIKTSDEHTVEVLKSEGFKLINQTNGIFTFINDREKKLVFDNKNLKVAYSNQMYI